MSITFERLFFALWPNQQVRERLSEVYGTVTELAGQGRLVTPSNFHITLHYLGNIPLQRVDCFIKHAQRIQSPCFELEINRLGYFKRPKISWLGPVVVPPALLQLQLLLGENIKQCGHQPELRSYQPHLTMARKIKQPVTGDEISCINWKLHDFVLVKSITQGTSVRYQVKSTFPLKQVN